MQLYVLPQGTTVIESTILERDREREREREAIAATLSTKII